MSEESIEITIIEKVVEKLEAEKVVDGKLSTVKTIDWGSSPMPMPSSSLPLIFVSATNLRIPEIRAALGGEYSYDEYLRLIIVIYVYVVKNGYRQAFTDALNIMKNVLYICHINKKWDNICYSSEVAEDDEIEMGMVPWGENADDVVYGITIPLLCRSISQ